MNNLHMDVMTILNSPFPIVTPPPWHLSNSVDLCSTQNLSNKESAVFYGKSNSYQVQPSVDNMGELKCTFRSPMFPPSSSHTIVKTDKSGLQRKYVRRQRILYGVGYSYFRNACFVGSATCHVVILFRHIDLNALMNILIQFFFVFFCFIYDQLFLVILKKEDLSRTLKREVPPPPPAQHTNRPLHSGRPLNRNQRQIQCMYLHSTEKRYNTPFF